MNKTLKAQYEGEPIKILDMEIECAVLEDGTRVVSQRAINKALKITTGGGKTLKDDEEGGGRKLPRYIYIKALEPFISENLRAGVINPVNYLNLDGTPALGTPADLMGDICQVWIDADNAGALKTTSQKLAAAQARIMQAAVGKIGWIALVDEATGYQSIRDKDALQKLLSFYVAKEFQPYFKTFVEAFYEEIYRLQGWQYDPKKNKYQVVGKWTLQYVYGCLPSAVVDAVKAKTPRTKSGSYTKKLFQSLTQEVGKPHLDRALGGVIALLKSSNTWGGFKRAYARAYGDQQIRTLPLSVEMFGEDEE